MKKGLRGTGGVRRSARKSTYQGKPSVYSTPEAEVESTTESDNDAAADFDLVEVSTRSGNPDLPVLDPGAAEVVGGSPDEAGGVMAPNSRLKYGRFKGDGSQDVDDWLCEFVSTANANQETEESKLRMFQGVLKGEALKWFQDVPDDIRAN